MDREQERWTAKAMRVLVLFVLLTPLVRLIPPVYASSNTLPHLLPQQHELSRDEIIARAKSWVQVPVSYSESQIDLYQGYRKDCSGFVSWAWELPGPGLTTYTLPSISHQINKDDLQPGDILLNSDGGGNPDFAHVVIFDSWVDSSHTHYNAYEESPYYNQAHETKNIPYPYWLGYYNSQLDYIPMRLNSLSNPTSSKPITVPMPSTQTNCPAADTARAAVTAPLALGSHQNVVYVYNEGTQQAPTFGFLKRYDVTTNQKTEIVKLANASITEAQISADGQWVLFVSQVSGQPALQMVRLDGQGLQTLHCASSTQSIYGLSWSPDQTSLVFNEGRDLRTSSPSDNSSKTYLLNIASGTLQLMLIQPWQPNQNSSVYYIPKYWIDNSRLYMLEYTESGLDNPITGLDLLDTKKGSDQHGSNLLPVTKFSGALFQSFTLSPDRTNLFLTQCSCSFPSGTGPSSITVQSAAGGTQKTIYTNQTTAITGVYPITNTSLLLLMENYANADVNVDTSQNGLWKVNTDGTGLMRLTTESTTQNSEHTILNDESSSPWSNISRDGTMYAAEIVNRVDNNSSISFTSILIFSFLSGNAPTQNFASAPATDLFTTQVTIVAWTSL